MIPINEYVSVLINARRYSIMNEKSEFYKDDKGYPVLNKKFKGSNVYIYADDDILERCMKDMDMVIRTLNKAYPSSFEACCEKLEKSHNIKSSQLKLDSVSVSPIVQENGLFLYYVIISFNISSDNTRRFTITMDIASGSFFEVKWKLVKR